MTLTIKLDGNWSSFQLANSAPPLSVTGSATARPQGCMPTRRNCSVVTHSHILALCLRQGERESAPAVYLSCCVSPCCLLSSCLAVLCLVLAARLVVRASTALCPCARGSARCLRSCLPSCSAGKASSSVSRLAPWLSSGRARLDFSSPVPDFASPHFPAHASCCGRHPPPILPPRPASSPPFSPSPVPPLRLPAPPRFSLAHALGPRTRLDMRFKDGDSLIMHSFLPPFLFKLTWLVLGGDPADRSHRVEQFTAL